MLRIMIIDDERIILNGLHMMIEDDLELPFSTDIVTASNVPTAIEFLNYFTPDLILTDIRMPVMDGFELIRHVREELPAVNIVILTSHADFEYAQKAIRFQVTDFILKPVSAEILKKTLEEAYSRKQEKEQSALRLALLELRNMMLYDLSSQELISTPEQIHQIFPHTYFTVVVISLTHTEDAYPSILEKILLEHYTLCHCFLLKEKDQLIAICNHIQFFVKPRDLEQRFFQASHCKTFWTGISISSNSYKSLHSLYSNALQRIFYARNFGKSSSLVEISLFSYQDCIQIFTENDSGKLLSLLQEYLTSIAAASSKELISPQMIYDSFFHNIFLYLENNGISISCSESVPVFCRSENLEALVTEIAEVLGCVKNKLQQNNDYCGNDALIRQLLEYIRQHFKEDISLDDLADCVGLHPNYVCSLFKKSAGQSYLSYLHKERLNAAKNLLLSTDYTIEQIAAEVGYSSSSQLARIFRKYESLSPSDYRNSHENSSRF